jgi:hypothetical protein
MKHRGVRAALAFIAGLSLASCSDRVAPAVSGTSEVVLDIATGPIFQQSSATAFVHVRVTYATATGSSVALFDEQIPLASMNSQQLSVSVDIAPCLSDPARSGSASGCPISVSVTLLDAAKAVLDARTIGPIVVAPDQPPATIAATLNSRFSVTVTKSGLGSGNVTFNPAASSAGGGLFTANSNVTLTAAPSATSIFSGWSGSCSGTSLTCTIRADANKTANAAFDTTYAVAVTLAGTGSGSVSASPPGPRYAPGTSVTLTAAAASGSVFSGWSGDCSGSSVSCVLIMSNNRSAVATFQPVPQFTLSVTTSGSGSGTVTRNPSASSYASGTSVTLTATPSSGSVFAGWSGACSGTSSTCSVTMTSNQSVGATFTLSNTTYDGDYTGTFSGDATGSVVFTVRNGSISLTQPRTGSGSVTPGGSATIVVTDPPPAGCTKNFSGQLFVVGNGLSGGGNWTCAAETGTWSVTGTRVP